MSVERKRRVTLIRFPLVLFILCAICAWSSNPDEGCFQRWLGRHLQAEGEAWLATLPNDAASRLVLSATDSDYTNVGFFSVVQLRGETTRTFVGVWGQWFALERGIGGDAKDQITSSKHQKNLQPQMLGICDFFRRHLRPRVTSADLAA